MLTKDERILLDNVIEADNRIYDGVSTVADLHAILLATAAAFRDTPRGAAFETAARQVRDIMQSRDSSDRKRDLAQIATDDLRQLVAHELKQDAIENSKQRHKKPEH